ncbi:MAG: hypothetical protein KGL57_07520 [Burkholderiales bacterium]|nr:hypothetical protein [Burkholderiales bacterium]
MPTWTRLAFLGRILRVLVFPLATVLLGHVVLFNVEQAQEALQAIMDEPGFSAGLMWFACAHFLWSLSAWYTARLLLCKRWVSCGASWSDPIGQCVSASWARAWVTWLPRGLAVVSAVPSAAVLFSRGQWRPAWALTVGALVLLVGLAFRRRIWMRMRGGRALAYIAQAGEQWERFDRISASGWLVLVGLSILPWLLALFGGLGGQAQLSLMARHIGTPGLVLLGLASYNVVGTLLLVYGPMTRGWGSWAWVPVLFWLVFSAFNENHLIGKRLDVDPPTSAAVAPDADLSRWLAQRRAEGRQNDPIYLVALSGGASRAAYWGAYTLAWLDDQQRARQGAFLSDVYALSGVSGGSLGASTLVAALASAREATLRDANAGPTSPFLADWMSDVLTLDHLSPVVQSLLYLDLMGRLSPVPLLKLDRSHALERTWEHDTLDAASARQGAQGIHATNWFRRPMEALYDADTDACRSHQGDGQGAPCLSLLPRLILNATSAETGEPVLQTALALRDPMALHVRDAAFGLQHMSLSEAVHNSARFPYLSPAGQVRSADGDHGVDYWVDGGYFENSGAWALQVLLLRWAQSPQWHAQPHAWDEFLSHVRVIVFSNDPVTADSPSWLPPDGVSDVNSQRQFPKRSTWMMEVVAPALGLYATRTARGQAETYRLAHLLAQMRAQAGLPTEPAVYQLRMPLTSAETPSMNWFINRRSSCVLRSYVLDADQCPAVGVPPMPPDWRAASGYQRYRAELTRLMAELRAQPAGPGLPPRPLQALPSTP